jgi:hypothetical protein
MFILREPALHESKNQNSSQCAAYNGEMVHCSVRVSVVVTDCWIPAVAVMITVDIVG